MRIQTLKDQTTLERFFAYTETNPTLSRVLSRMADLPGADRVLQWLRSNAKELERFIKFGVVGTSGAVVDFGLLNFFHLALGWPLVWSNTCSFSAAVLNNFTWNRLWTFPESRKRPIQTQLPQFALVNVIGLGINQVTLLGLDTYVFRPLLGPLGYNVAKAIATIVVLFWNFGINRIWTYGGL